MVSSKMIFYTIVIALPLLALSRILMGIEARRQRSFARSPGRIALGLPAIADSSGSPARRERIEGELRQISRDYRQRYARIKAVLDEFALSGSLRIRRPDDSEFILRSPRKYLDCDVVLGVSLAGAGLTPGTALYWLPLPGPRIAQELGRDDASQTRIAHGATHHVAIDEFEFDLQRDAVQIADKRLGALPQLRLQRGTAILLKLDENSEETLQSTLGSDAPAIGTSKKVRLFGGFEMVDGELMIVPLRQEINAPAPTEGFAFHPISSLVGVVVAEIRDKAFAWRPDSALLPESKVKAAA